MRVAGRNHFSMHYFLILNRKFKNLIKKAQIPLIPLPFLKFFKVPSNVPLQ